MATRQKNKAIAYLRRSGNQQEASLEQQLDWVLAKAEQLGLNLDASEQDLAYMQNNQLSSYKDIRLDDAITGANLKRPGFVCFINDCISNKSISHGLVFQRDRFARPEEALEMVLQEKYLGYAGVTLVLSTKVVEPAVRGAPDFGAELATLFEYYESGNYLRRLAQYIILSHQRQAREGYSSGGTPPYGFVRALFNSDGEFVEYLPKGRVVRQVGYKVRWVVGPSEEDKAKIRTWLLILDLKHQGWGAKRIARHLNELGIPSPGAGTRRRDHGIEHTVSGKWGSRTVLELCENKMILGIKEYGRRSEGAHRRISEDGYRLLDEADRDQEGKPRLIHNDASVIIETKTDSPELFEKAKWEEIQQETQRRGKSQRGIPRAKDPAKYPLSCRVVDLTDNCGAMMYGVTNGGRSLYRCSDYMRFKACHNNSIDAEALLKFVLKVLSDQIGSPKSRDKLKKKLKELATSEIPKEELSLREKEHRFIKSQLTVRSQELETVQRNMARETDETVYGALREEYLNLKTEVARLQCELQSSEDLQMSKSARTPDQEVDAAMALLDDITRIAADKSARMEIPQILDQLGMRIGLKFVGAIKGKKRKVRRLACGIITFGNTEPSLQSCSCNEPDEGNNSSPKQSALPASADKVMQEETGRVKRKSVGEKDNPSAQSDGRPEYCHREGISLTKGSRAERI